MMQIRRRQWEQMAGSGEPTTQQCPYDPSSFRIRLLDADGDPQPNEHFKVTWPDGATEEGRLDDEGQVTLEVRTGEPVVQFPFRYPAEMKPLTGRTRKL